MKFLFFILAVLLTATGCSSKYDIGTPEQKERRAKMSFFIIRSDDGKIGIMPQSSTNLTLDGVNIQAARALTAAVDKIVKETSKRFAEPDELSRITSEMARGAAPKTLHVGFGIINGKKTADSLAFATNFEYKTFDHTNPYYSKTGLNFSCEGDTEKVCTEKFMESTRQALKPVIVRFIKDHGY